MRLLNILQSEFWFLERKGGGTMGFDLCGVRSRSEKGDYFRNNVWWWRPLWKFICENCDSILTEKQKMGGSFNDGTLISENQALEIADALQRLIDSGEVRKYQKARKKALDSLPDEECAICKGKGIRDDKFVKGKCNACGGKGKRRPWICSYPFAEINVKAFCEFVKESGGFGIY